MDGKELDQRITVVRSVLFKKTRDIHLIEDLSQAALVKCLEYEQREGRPPSVSYVITVAENMYCSWWRTRHSRKRKLQPLSEGYDGPAKEENPAESLERQEQFQVVRSALEALPPLYRDIAQLYLIENWALLKIAQHKDVPHNTVKTRIRRARSLLRVKLREHLLN